MSTEELLWKLLIMSKNNQMHIALAGIDFRTISEKVNYEDLKKAIDFITDYDTDYKGLHGLLTFPVSFYLTNGRYDFIPVTNFKDENNLRTNLSITKKNISRFNNGDLFAIIIFAILMNWKELFDICERQLESNANSVDKLGINKEDIKKCVKYIIDNGKINDFKFTKYYEDNLKQYVLD